MRDPSRPTEDERESSGTFTQAHDFPVFVRISRSEPHTPPPPHVAYAFPCRTAKSRLPERWESQAGNGPTTSAPSSMRDTNDEGGSLKAPEPTARLPSMRNWSFGPTGPCSRNGFDIAAPPRATQRASQLPLPVALRTSAWPESATPTART